MTCKYYGCIELTSVTIPNSVTSIGQNVFEDCTGLTSITLGNSVANIGKNAFKNCTNLKRIDITDLVSWCEKGKAYWFPSGSSFYYNNKKISELVIPNSVTRIGSNAFAGYTDLTSVTIPNSVTSIGDNAFNGCTGLTKITIPNSVTNIGVYAFTDTNLNDVYINIVDFASENRFYHLGKKQHYLYEGKEIAGAFTIPNFVTSIGNKAFCGCTGLTSITIPNSVTSIGYNAFYGCDNIEDILVLTKKPFAIESNVFSCQTYATLHVLEKFVPVFKDLGGWKDFYFIEGTSSETIDKADKMDTNRDGEVNSADVVRIYNYIITGDDVKTKMDTNGDGEVNSADVVRIYNYIITRE